MMFLLDIVILFIRIIIKIGDAVIALLTFLSATLSFKTIRNIANVKRQKTQPIISFFIKQKQRLTALIPRVRIIAKKVAPSISPIAIYQAPAMKPARHGIKKSGKKRKRTQQLFALSYLTKFKYFIAGGIFSLLFLFLPLLLILFVQDLPSPKELVFRQIPQTTKIYDRNKMLLYQIYASQNRTLVPLNQIPSHLQHATIAIEDKDFYKHPGFDVTAIIRSALKNISGEGLQGGSTITQQLIKSALLTPETSVTRKVKEVILAFWAERIYSKSQILEMYFNQIPYGGTAWGVEAAAEVYFGKHVQSLNLAQSAFLAGIPKAPTIYSPYGETPTLWKKRQQEVLRQMRALGYITKKQEEQAMQEPLHFKQPQTPLRAPHFAMYIKDLLVRHYGLPMVERGGLTVITSIDMSLQEKTQKIVTEEVLNDAYLNLTNGAALITNPKNGDILAMVGSKDYNNQKDGNVNLTISLRQPGSSIKAVTYSAALSKGFTAATILDDSPVTYTASGAPPYSPVNYDGKFHGKIPLRIALGNSFNVPAVRTLNTIGIAAMVSLGKSMGIKSWGDPKQYGLSITLGSAEVTMIDMATVYATIANKGARTNINPILKITDYNGNVLEEKKGGESQLVLDPGVAFIISNILSDNNARMLEFGTNSPLNISGKTVSVKTGTSDNKRDNWTIGYTPTTLVAAWVGNNDNSPMSQNLASGITGAAPIWNKIMTMLLQNKPDEKLQIPANIIQKPCYGKIEYFLRGTENSVNCNFLPSAAPQPSKPY